MENTMLVALSRQGGLHRQMSVIANNIANMNTIGFKGENMMFIQHLERSHGSERLLSDKIAFVRDIATARDFTEGPMEKTGNPLDVAISGEGFLVIDVEGEDLYTRAGRLHLDNTGQLTTSQGFPVLSDAGQPFFFSPEDTEINISRDGTISTENGDLGRLRVVRFENNQQLRQVSGGLFVSEAVPEDVENPQVIQGMVESSNVEPILELTKMIEVSRSYESVKKLIDREDDRIKKMVKEVTG